MLNLTVASFSVLMLYAAYSDLRSYTLPNFISILLIIGFVCVFFVIQPSIDVLGWHIGVSILAFVIGFTMFSFGLFGGGDVKVIAALGLWFGPNNFLAFLVMMTVFGGILAVILIIFRRLPVPEKMLKFEAIKGLHNPEEGIPYGLAIAIAALMEFPKTEIYAALDTF